MSAIRYRHRESALAEYDFKNPLRGSSADYAQHSPGLLHDLVETPEFRRLTGVRFLGGIDYLLIQNPNGTSPNIRYTRFQHSVGVARLAIRYSARRNLPTSKANLVIAAALLHDVGHSPLSHTIEPNFKEWFGLDHHKVTESVIRGESALGSRIASVLRDYGVDREELISLLAGQSDDFDSIFSGPINIDTIEGILRAWAYAGQAGPEPTPEMILDASIDRNDEADEHLVDRFWTLKDRVYRYLIRSPEGVLFDQICQYALDLDRGSIRPSDFLASEEQLLRRSPTLASAILNGDLSSHVMERIHSSIEYVERRFLINRTSAFCDRQDGARYVQTKTRMTMKVPTFRMQAKRKDEGGFL